MKELICAKDIENLLERGEKRIFITSNTILTPSAKDIIKNNDIEIILKNKDEQKKEKLDFSDLDMEKLTCFFKLLIKENLYQDVIEKLLTGKGYIQEKDPEGFILTRGESIKYKKINKDNLEISYQEIKSGTHTITFVEMNNSKFLKKMESQEYIYIIGGKITIKINNREYIGNVGDILYIPLTMKNIIFDIKEKTKLLCISEESLWKEKNLLSEEVR